MMTGATVNGRPFRFLYDADNERIAAVERVPFGATRRNRTTFTLRGDGNQLLSTWTDDWISGSSVFARKEDTIWRGSQVLARAVGTDTTNYTPDHLGSPRLITDSAGAVIDEQNFDPFGSGGLFGSGALQFTGHERDQANIGGGTYDLPDYMHARYYDKSGRFLSIDPVPDSVSIGAPQTWNRYAYTLNNPINFTDPTGAVPCDTKLPGGHTPEGECEQTEANDPEREAMEAARRRLDDWLLAAMTKITPISAGVGDAMLFGFGDELRDFTDQAFGWEGGAAVDRCSDSYQTASVVGSTAMLAVGSGRLAYAGAAKALSLTARSAEQAIRNRNALKVAFRLGLDRTSRVYAVDKIIAKYGAEGAIAAAGRTSPAWNAAGAAGVAGAVKGFFNLPNGCP